MFSLETAQTLGHHLDGDSGLHLLWRCSDTLVRSPTFFLIFFSYSIILFYQHELIRETLLYITYVIRLISFFSEL